MHVWCDEEQDAAAGDLESSSSDIEMAAYPRAARRKEQHDGGAFNDGTQLLGASLQVGYGKENRRVADWLDNHKAADEGYVKTAKHGICL